MMVIRSFTTRGVCGFKLPKSWGLHSLKPIGCRPPGQHVAGLGRRHAVRKADGHPGMLGARGQASGAKKSSHEILSGAGKTETTLNSELSKHVCSTLGYSGAPVLSSLPASCCLPAGFGGVFTEWLLCMTSCPQILRTWGRISNSCNSKFTVYRMVYFIIAIKCSSFLH